MDQKFFFRKLRGLSETQIGAEVWFKKLIIPVATCCYVCVQDRNTYKIIILLYSFQL